MVMCHMIADSEKELHDMADKIGVARRWCQGDHYDICLTKKKLAIQFGAIELSTKDLCKIIIKRRKKS